MIRKRLLIFLQFSAGRVRQRDGSLRRRRSVCSQQAHFVVSTNLSGDGNKHGLSKHRSSKLTTKNDRDHVLCSIPMHRGSMELTISLQKHKTLLLYDTSLNSSALAARLFVRVQSQCHHSHPTNTCIATPSSMVCAAMAQGFRSSHSLRLRYLLSIVTKTVSMSIASHHW